MKIKIIFYILAILLIWQCEAHAYINPSSGSEFFQIVMSLFAALIANIKKILHIKSKDDGKKYE